MLQGAARRPCQHLLLLLGVLRSQVHLELPQQAWQLLLRPGLQVRPASVQLLLVAATLQLALQPPPLLSWPR